MLTFALKSLGWLVAHTPEPALRLIAAALGDFIFFLLPRRRRLVLSNLHHAFPEKPARWHRTIGRESCRRLIETGLLSLATPYLSEARWREMISASPALVSAHSRHKQDPAATLICSPHLAYWEGQTAQYLVIPAPHPEFGVIFRPLDNPAADAFVKRSRERFGLKLLSRKDGFAEALKILRRRGWIGVLFDQNAGMQGALTTLFGRVCATTELPGLMAEKFQARVFGIFPHRRAFWRVEIDVEPIAHDNTSEAVTIGLNRWLEDLLRRDDNLCASWLWAHDRWRNQDMPSRRFRLEAKRDLLSRDLALRCQTAPERRTRIWIRLPNWLGDVVIALPLLRALRLGRPDAEVTLVAKKQFVPLLTDWAVADRVHALPSQGIGYFRHFRQLSGEHPDVWLLFTNSFRGDLEAWLTGCRQRFGIVRPGKSRPLLSHAYRVPPEFEERTRHQLELWTEFLKHFGLAADLDRTPLGISPTPNASRATRQTGMANAAGAARLYPEQLQTPNSGVIALIPGSENTPEKRWPVPHWRRLIESLPHEQFVIFGTPNDAAIASAVADGLAAPHVTNLAGKTDLPTFAEQLRGCRVLVTNDTGGMHLANALGVPLIALFGPTNPVRTGPVFSAPAIILQPPDCPRTGGGSLANLAPETVLAALRTPQHAPVS